jgi:hypothetical protein
VKTGVRVRYDNPREVGADRVVDAAAAYKYYGGPACVIDSARARRSMRSRPRVITSAGRSAPASASPRTRCSPRGQALRDIAPAGRDRHQHRALVAVRPALRLRGTGRRHGRALRRLGAHMHVIGTGGLAELIARETKIIEVVDPWLTLRAEAGVSYESMNMTAVKLLANKHIVLGVTGSIAAQGGGPASKLTQAGARVDVILTEAATRFVTP